MAEKYKAAPRPKGGPGARVMGEKPVSARQSLKFLWGYLKARKGLLVLAFLMVLINTVASLAGTNNSLPPSSSANQTQPEPNKPTAISANF